MITRLALKGYRRVSLFMIDYIDINPQEGLTFILGDNGSGKSSLLRQLTPYPGHNREFEKNGYKIVELTVDQKEYVLTSKFTRGTGIHSFFCKSTGIEHNPGGTRRVQIELVEKFFKWDKNLLDVLVGIKKFTHMSVSERRYWLRRLCPVDISPALDLHKACTTRARDMKGAVRQLSDRLVRDAKDIVDNATLNQITKDIEYHHERLSVLYPELNDVIKTDDNAIGRYQSTLENAEQVLANYPVVSSFYRFESEERYKEELLRLQQGVKDANDKERHLVDATFEVTNQIEELKAISEGKDNVDDLKVALKALIKERDKLTLSELSTEYPIILPSDVGITLDAFEVVFKRFCQVLAGTPDNEDGKFTKERVEHAKAYITNHMNNVRLIEQRVYATEGRIENIRQCETLSCPKCQHGFKPGVDPNEEKQLLKNIELDNQQIDKLKKEVEKAQVYLDDFDSYYQEVMAYQHLTREYPSFTSLWEYCNEQKIVTRVPRQHVIPINDWGYEMLRRDRLATVEKKIKEHNDIITFLEGIDKKQLSRLQEEEKKLKAQHEAVFKLRRDNEHILHHIEKDYRNLVTYRVQLEDALERLTGAIEGIYALVEGYYQDAVKEELQQHQSQLSRLNQENNRHKVLEATQQALEEERASAEEDQKLYELLADTLNPNTGLIADYLSSSMGNCVKRMNAIINHIWSYPIDIQVSPIDKDDLTYRFPMLVGDNKEVCDDILEGSSSQQDIVNFAFRMTVASCLELHGMPLYVDELGAAFDERHRAMLVNMLDSMMELGELPQVFFITHYQGTHSAFKHADYIVLNEHNITVPRLYNQHVTFKEPEHGLTPIA